MAQNIVKQSHSQEEDPIVLQEAHGQHHPNIIGNIEDEQHPTDMDDMNIRCDSQANERMMDLGSAPQFQKENIFMEGSKVSLSKRSGRSKSPSKFSFNMYDIPKSMTRSMKRKSQ